ncbi:hypothetical protein ACFYWY_01800 [Streptomyces sp. NPDC002870]|uniref:hypothetical protein n=1 Tax=Streptomyces sp. NPDC002870 TaxID=3364666 RepID=UPI00367D4C58
MVVYASRIRTDASPKRAAETESEFFDRIAGPFWDQVRNVINEWWSHFPDQTQPGLRSRLLDRNSDSNVHSALWELYLHEMLLGSGCTVEIEPGIGTRGTNPDFLVTREGKQFVVEAKWTVQRLDETVPNRQLPPILIDAIDAVPSPNFFVSYRIHQTGSATPSQRRLKAGLKRWLASLDPDQVIAEHAPDEDVETALYGTSVEYVHNSTPTFGRQPNGYWTATYDHAHSRVSGVLTVNNPAPWTWTKNTPILWQSPDPSSLPALVLPTWATAQVVDVHVEHQPPACPIYTALGLPEHWPVGDPFPRRRRSNAS